MKANLERHYDRLTPRERVAAMNAAWIRGDDAEAEALQRTAPERTYKAPEHLWYGNALRQVELAYLASQLDNAITFWRGMHLSDTESARAESLAVTLRALAYRIIQSAEGWRLFCEGLGIPAPGLIATAPGGDNLAQTIESAQIMAFTRDEMIEWLNLRGTTADDAQLDPEVSAQRWRDALEELA